MTHSWLSGVSAHQPREEMVFSGKYKTGEQILRLANERFAVPEMLFHPSDIGIQEMGIPEAIVHSVESLPEGQRLIHGGVPGSRKHRFMNETDSVSVEKKTHQSLSLISELIAAETRRRLPCNLNHGDLLAASRRFDSQPACCSCSLPTFLSHTRQIQLQ